MVIQINTNSVNNIVTAKGSVGELNIKKIAQAQPKTQSPKFQLLDSDVTEEMALVEEINKLDLNEYINNSEKIEQELKKLEINPEAVIDKKVIDDETIEISFRNGVVCQYKVESDGSLTIISGIGYDIDGNIVYKGEKNLENNEGVAEYFDAETGSLVHKITYYSNGNIKTDEYNTIEGYKQSTIEYNENGQKTRINTYDGTAKQIKTNITNYSYDETGALISSRSVDFTNARIIDTEYTGEASAEYRIHETISDAKGKILKDLAWDYENSKVTIKNLETGETEIQTYDGTKKIQIDYYDANGNLYKTTTPADIIIEDMMNTAADQIGNVGGEKFWSWYGFNSRQPWCACFVSWVANQAGVLGTEIPKFAAVSQGMNWFKDRGEYESSNSGYIPKAGDVIFFGNHAHVGIVEKYENGRVYTIEGNCNNTCARRDYDLNDSYINGYGTPDYLS